MSSTQAVSMTPEKSLPLTSHLSRLTMARKPLLVLVGPTAVGKSDIAVQVARALGTEVLTADSRQVYRGMDIGMDKPSLDQRAGVPHRLIDLANPDQPFNAGMFRRHALHEIERLYREHKLPLVVGGTGLYVRTLLRGLCDAPQADPEFRSRLLSHARGKGSRFLYEELTRVDQESAGRLHPHDEVKILRALEVYHLSGRPLSEVQRDHGFADAPFTPCLIGLMRDREALNRRIEDRVELQLAKGLVAETERLLGQGYRRDLGSMKGLGYRQIAGYLAGEYDYAEAVRQLKRDTRRFAKRQLTWFRKEPGLTWLSIAEGESSDRIATRVLIQVDTFLATLADEGRGMEESVS